MKKIYSLALPLVAATMLSCSQQGETNPGLVFNAEEGTPKTLVMPQGDTVRYTAHTKLYFVANVEDSTYQYMNVFVPEGATQQSPIFLRTNIGGYMASQAGNPKASDASGRALKEGYVLVIPGSRGRNSVVNKDGKDIYTGRAPMAILDLKAAIRYLRLFDKEMLGDAEKIITDGTSAGGAMSALMGGTGNAADYEPMLKAMGAASTRDDVFASVCYCPITDLDHADMAYEWLYCGTDSRGQLDEGLKKISSELAAQFPEYINSLNLKKADGTPLNGDNYLDYIKSELIRSAQIAKNAGAEISTDLGFKFNSEGAFDGAPINGGPAGGMKPDFKGEKPDFNGEKSEQIGDKPNFAGGAPHDMKPGNKPPMGGMMGGNRTGEYIVDLDMPTYLNYVVSTRPLKTVPAFDSLLASDAVQQKGSGENEEFGDSTGSIVNFTDYVARLNGTTLTDEVKLYVKMLNPMYYIGVQGTDVAPHWYIRHGARDRDTAFPIALNLATKLQNEGKDVDFLLAWNRPHSGDYSLDELFAWIASIVK